MKALVDLESLYCFVDSKFVSDYYLLLKEIALLPLVLLDRIVNHIVYQTCHDMAKTAKLLFIFLFFFI